MREKACVFVDGENLRHSLIDVFAADGIFRPRDYLPALACDMLMLRDIYDTAIIVSGDQDYVPAAQVLKDAGKTVVNVSFERRNGDLLPGGARRLNIATDASIRIPYTRLREFMGLDTPGVALEIDTTVAGAEAIS